ncbi:hypothetical protein F4553_001648 [Allocatelliglobosispora scoriae]|uniref:SIR2-like domain-containing protein n=1 Tax=Allocatelliglobosispora scoriae TaxID=643052 RepID=A0A841BM47_9ACTN|nr:hypothetical protein [Allocatelliglobosispora scoriae]MBB5868269.1 hypothetical protein [Allocatelliglobosispora scoriae]
MPNAVPGPVPADLVGELFDASPADVLFWSGAGISMVGPSSLPTGWELTNRAFESFFDPGALDVVLGHHRRAGWLSPEICDRAGPDGVRPPRLETVLGVALRRLGTRAHDVLADVREAVPNWNHAFFAEHIAAGGKHVTANFDSCVEDAFQARYATEPPASVEHFHGRLTAGTSVAELGATLDRIQAGFGPAYADELVGLVAARPLTVMVGYSGGDFFDVDVAFDGLAGDRLAGREVVWLAHHHEHAWHLAQPGPAAEPRLGRRLAAAGARVRYLCGPTQVLLSHLATAWGLPVEAPEATVRSPRRIVSDTTSAQRRTATFALFRELGIPVEVDRMLHEGDLDGIGDADRWLSTSEVLWEQGRWSTLRRMWQRADLPVGISPALRAERIGACLWAQGRLLPAYLWLERHRAVAARRGRPDDAWLLAETQARVVEHMARTPDLRWLGGRLAARAAARLGRPEQAAGVHLFRRHTDLTTSLAAVASGTARSGGVAQESQRWFTEAGSLTAAIAYAHRALRDGYDSEADIDETSARYRDHQRWALSVGSPAAAWRMILLPGADRVFTFRETVAATLELEYGHWHRVRILGRYAVLRLRRRRSSRPVLTAGRPRR